MHSGTYFWYRNASKMPQKIFACGGHNVIDIRFVIPLKCIFFASAAGIIVLLCFMLVYRALLDKHKTLNFDQLQARKKL